MKAGNMKLLRPLNQVLNGIDAFLERMARLSGWAALALVVIIVYDVITRRFGLPRLFGVNATQLQETEYWLHTLLFAFAIAHTYRIDGHVRIDIFRKEFSLRKKLWIEVFGNLFFLIPVSVIALKFHVDYALRAYHEGATSNSTLGLGNVWILKSVLCLMFLTLGVAGIAALIRALLALRGSSNTPDNDTASKSERASAHQRRGKN